jgi:ADP-ribosylglycohydrolase
MARTLRLEYIRWATQDARRAPGHTCMAAVHNMMQDIPWVRATIVESKGCGSNMRVSPAAFIADEDTALGVAALQGAMTHGHPTSIAATELTALAVRLAARGLPLTSLVDQLLVWAYDAAESGLYRADWLGSLSTRWEIPVHDAMYLAWMECVDGLINVRKLLGKRKPMRNACDKLGEGWVAEEALFLAVYYAVTYRNDAVIAVSEAARTNGDSDSIAAITGAIIGASLGGTAWPRSWRGCIERRDEIECAINVAEVVS